MSGERKIPEKGEEGTSLPGACTAKWNFSRSNSIKYSSKQLNQVLLINYLRYFEWPRSNFGRETPTHLLSDIRTCSTHLWPFLKTHSDDDGDDDRRRIPISTYFLHVEAIREAFSKLIVDSLAPQQFHYYSDSPLFSYDWPGVSCWYQLIN